ncbi:hypothetical protein [Gillisia limnaea]|uniref:BLUF domain-containing protein n=1 Tax=Gillisia limnaea (strain DSM 15749 / LMG 21470 / R-8282) TaxID=865937 RepID=H2BX57_GILLR|nr:hypothetical protein [Gillisia limnaea]EHQ02009.1 hypothetical protein Gilli_1343 [Gillisia limnaea DSM 15749]
MDLFGKIERDSRHHNIILVLGREIEQVAYDGYLSDTITNDKKRKESPLHDYLDQAKGLAPPI